MPILAPMATTTTEGTTMAPTYTLSVRPAPGIPAHHRSFDSARDAGYAFTAAAMAMAEGHVAEVWVTEYEGSHGAVILDTAPGTVAYAAALAMVPQAFMTAR